MTQWTFFTCTVDGDGFLAEQDLDWPLPLTGHVTFRLKDVDEPIDLELQTDFSDNFSAVSSDGRYWLSFRYSRAEDGRHYLTGALTRHSAGEQDIEAFTAVTGG